ncbi:MAG: response regulator transcription factor [Acidimicrobiia bacterium]|nr:response regulator transcription factor [Acidimicrobiia bacterium]
MVKVLIVDDQEPFRSAARMVVELTEGFEVVGEAETGEEGVEMAAGLEPDLVLIDINMPGINGLEATRRITEARPATKVVIFSTYEAGEYESRAKDAGAIAFIPKSDFDPVSLVSTWEQAGQ